ncbi:MAG: hypothetical protein P8182_08200 [Deltaproteobacteria bacterium]
MGLRSQELPEAYRGPWCDRELARQNDTCDECGVEERVDRRLRDHWARALLSGDLKRAHKLWGKWQGFTGNDPWEDNGWRRFWELQRMGGKLWEDFDASNMQGKMLLRTFISYWPGFRENAR